ncbi:hypothetical protein DF186_16355, partial [Enterococcus hirae]
VLDEPAFGLGEVVQARGDQGLQRRGDLEGGDVADLAVQHVHAVARDDDVPVDEHPDRLEGEQRHALGA